MLFTITGKHLEITEDLKGYAEKKSAKFPRYYDRINRVEVIIDGSEGGGLSVEIIVSGVRNKVFVGKGTGQDAYKCIDEAVHKLERQLKRRKGKERDNKHTNSTG
ncbi:MAG TPA: ribosome-associated translation inhibitor RaiA [Sedimentisphaerales bacterium]|nr:ribosome-associated translation inhibitor RaiA [Sedimentisphaerales bacterium]